MADRPSLSMQLGALQHCVAYAGKHGLSDSIIKSAEGGIETMTFLRDNRDVFLTFYTIMQAFPGSVVKGASDVSDEEEQPHV